MSVKVRRGLGLLVVAVIGWLITFGLLQADATPLVVLSVLTGVVTIAAAGVGVVLLAWGLLRD